jgi:hypothetical protein
MAEGTMLDAIVKFLMGRFGQESIMRWGLVLSVILILAVVYSFFIKETSSSFEKYYEFKLARCNEAALATARIATSDDEKVLREALTQFDELYYGQLVIFEGRKLETAMIEFRGLLTTTSASPSAPSASPAAPSASPNTSAEQKIAAARQAANASPTTPEEQKIAAARQAANGSSTTTSKEANAESEKSIQKDQRILYEAFRENRNDANKATQLRQAALRVSAACYLEVTPSLLAAMLERLIPWPREKYTQ